MSTYLLDTNVCVEYLRNASGTVATRLKSRQPDDIRLCSVVAAELIYGWYRSKTGLSQRAVLDRFLSEFESLPFDDAAAKVAGRIREELAMLGTPIGPYDLQIAAIALANNLTVVTHNVAEFSRVAGLAIEDWQK